MTIPEIISLFHRDLDKLKKELEAYRNEANVWKTGKEISNSAGHLAMHLVGNLQHFIGTELGRTDYVRDRENEFSGEPVAIATLVEEVDTTKSVLAKTLQSLSDSELAGPFPGKIPYDMHVSGFLLHLYGHLTYHLGQINYHRRLLDN